MNNPQKISALLLIAVNFVFFGLVSGVLAEQNPLLCTEITTTLRPGSRSKDQVVELQNFLRNQGHFKSDSTGNFGTVTANAVKSFQKARGLETTGSVGPLTRAEILKISCSATVKKPEPVKNPTTVNTPVKSDTQVAQVITPTIKPDLPYNPTDFSDWQKNWGVITKKDNGNMLLKSNESETSVHVSYPNSKDWKDYKYTASVNVTNGNIMLVSRRVDDKNLLMCAFSGNIIQIQQKVDDKIKILASTALSDMPNTPYFLTSLTVSMKVKGNTVSCSLLGNDNLTYTGIDSKLSKGGIGIQSWYAAPGSAKIEVSKVSVEAAD